MVILRNLTIFTWNAIAFITLVRKIIGATIQNLILKDDVYTHNFEFVALIECGYYSRCGV